MNSVNSVKTNGLVPGACATGIISVAASTVSAAAFVAALATSAAASGA